MTFLPLTNTAFQRTVKASQNVAKFDRKMASARSLTGYTQWLLSGVLTLLMADVTS